MKFRCCCFAISFAVLVTGSAALRAERLNVLFIAVDDLRPQLGCYDYPGMITPNLDQLASRGTVFNRAYCQAAVCRASRASLLLGLRPDSTEIWSNGSRRRHFRDHLPDTATLPQHFKNNGYHSQSFGKIFHGAFVVRSTWNDPASWVCLALSCVKSSAPRVAEPEWQQSRMTAM